MAKSERERYKAALGSLKLSKEQHEIDQEGIRRCYAIIGQLLEQAGGTARLEMERLMDEVRVKIVFAFSETEEGELPEYMFLSLPEKEGDAEPAGETL